ncbi:hypothetical protein [Aquabacterium sp. J223]|uniref:hypothetical protein n=1 Tax=Aquabacterium sp. J223 TaxID=2898431 RepID=UPI0021AD6F0F|nr:hypothetical protein [Aquabacterium sp. J223]UUX94233.1 hypothetical protein LRS07_12925 [Aquabacterium sp. J223]
MPFDRPTAGLMPPATAGSAAAWRVDAAVFSVVALGHLLVALFIRTYGWDDGTITLAFARTLATSGRIALTPESVTVEGSSSPLWMALMAVVHWLGRPGFDAFIAASQVAAGLCSAVAAVLLARLLRPLAGFWVAALLPPALFLGGPFLNETMNGMEMALLAAVVLGVMTALQRPRPSAPLLFALGAAMALLRLEGVAYAVGSALVLFVLQPASRRAALALALGALAGAAAMEAVRLWVFGDWLPNTVWAKRWWPYRPGTLGGRALVRGQALIEPWLPYAVALVAVLSLGGHQRVGGAVARVRNEPALLFAVAYVACVWGANTVMGRNWGYVSRMQLSALVLPVLLALAWRAPAWQAPRRVALLAVLTLLGSMTVLQWKHVGIAFQAQAGQPPRWGITPDSYRLTGLAVDRLRQRLGLERLSLMVPDVGGTALCCERLDIIDSALLTDPFLARHGYARFGEYLQQRRPDVIETHAMWSWVTQIYEQPWFVAHYQPVVVDGSWFWLRSDLAAALPAPGPAPADAHRLRYRGRGLNDEAFIAAHPQPVIVLD